MYMAAFLSYESQAQKVADWMPYLEDCKRTRVIDPATGRVLKVGIDVAPPDVNLSGRDFEVVYGPDEPRDAAHGHIRFGLGAIKGTGTGAVEAIVSARQTDQGVRPFKDLFDFCERVPLRSVNKATIEALVKAGAFDSIHGRAHRSAMLASIDAAVGAGQAVAADRAAGQGGLFGGAAHDEPATEVKLAQAAPWSEQETLRHEKETLGFYVSSHPLEQWGAWISAFAGCRLADLAGMAQGSPVVAGVLVQSVRVIVARSGRSAGQKMGILTLEDTTGTADAVLFTDAYQRYAHLLEDDGPKFVVGRLDRSRGDAQIIVDQLTPIEAVPLEGGTLRVYLRSDRLNGQAQQALEKVRQVALEHQATPGTAGDLVPTCPLELVVCVPGCEPTCVQATRPARVRLEPALIAGIEQALGPRSVRLYGGRLAQAGRNGNASPYGRGRTGAQGRAERSRSGATTVA